MISEIHLAPINSCNENLSDVKSIRVLTFILYIKNNKIVELKKMEFVPTSHGNQTLVYNGYIFSKSKVNSSGSINWKCHNYFKKDQTHCKITCTTIGNEFVTGREAPMYHNDVN